MLIEAVAVNAGYFGFEKVHDAIRGLISWKVWRENEDGLLRVIFDLDEEATVFQAKYGYGPDVVSWYIQEKAGSQTFRVADGI